MTEKRQSLHALKNYASIAINFLVFAGIIAVIRLFSVKEDTTYLIGVGVIGLICMAPTAWYSDRLKRLLPYCFAFLFSAAAFPMSDLLPMIYGSPILYIGFFGMIFTAILLIWRAATQLEDEFRDCRKPVA